MKKGKHILLFHIHLYTNVRYTLIIIALAATRFYFY